MLSSKSASGMLCLREQQLVPVERELAVVLEARVGGDLLEDCSFGHAKCGSRPLLLEQSLADQLLQDV